MHKLLLLGATLLSFHGAHHRLYWHTGTVTCTIASGVRRNGSFDSTPYIVCTPDPGAWQWSSTPQVLNPSDYVNPTPGAQNYCPYDPNGNC